MLEFIGNLVQQENDFAVSGAQKTHTWSYRSQCTLYERLFSTTCGTSITDYGYTFRTMITDFFIPALHGIDVNDVWMQQDGAIWSTCHATMDLLHQMFDGRLINRNGDINWQPRIYD